MGGFHHVGALPARLCPFEDGDVHLAAAGRAFHEDGYAGGAVKVGLRPAEHGQVGSFFRGVYIRPVLVVADNGPPQAHGRLAGHHGYGYERRAALVIGEHEQPVQLVGIVAAAGGVGRRFLIFHASGHDGGGGGIGRADEGGAVLQDGAAGHPRVAAYDGGVNGLAGDGGIEHVPDKLAEREVERFLEIRAGTLRAGFRADLVGRLRVGGDEIKDGVDCRGVGVGFALWGVGKQGGQRGFEGGGKRPVFLLLGLRGQCREERQAETDQKAFEDG